MTTTRAVIIAVAAAVTAFGILVTPLMLIPLIPIATVLVIGARSHDHSVAAEAVQWARRWYLWFAAAAIVFVIGSAMLVADDDGDLSTAAWATLLMSWLAAAIIATIGVALGAIYFVNHRRS